MRINKRFAEKWSPSDRVRDKLRAYSEICKLRTDTHLQNTDKLSEKCSF